MKTVLWENLTPDAVLRGVGLVGLGVGVGVVSRRGGEGGEEEGREKSVVGVGSKISTSSGSIPAYADFVVQGGKRGGR